MTIATFITTCLSRDDHLFTRIYNFNNTISEYIDESHLEDVPFCKEHWSLLHETKRIRTRLSDYFLHYFNLKDQKYFSFEDPRLRLALVDRETIKQTLIYAGAAYYYEQISKIIKRQDLLNLKESVGENVYFFATKRASLIQALVPKLGMEKKGELCKDDLYEAGKRCFELCFANEVPALLERLKLKFPANIKWEFNLDIQEEQKTKAWNYLYRILIKEVEPSWKSCFI